VASSEYAQDENTAPVQQNGLNNQNLLTAKNPTTQWLKLSFTKVTSLALICLTVLLTLWFNSTQEVETKQVVILKPTLADSSSMAPMQQDLVISAVEDALRQAVINTKNMYLISQREVKAITKEYPNDLNKLRQAVGASDIISTTLECDNNRCKVSFSRLVVNENNSDNLSVKSEKNWLAPIDKFNAIFSTSQTQFASLFTEQSEVNQSGLVQRPINENDYRNYIELYSQIKGQGEYSIESLTKLEALLTRSPYLYAAYALFRETASNLYLDTRDKSHLKRLALILQNSPPEYRYSVYHAIDSFWLASSEGDMTAARFQIGEAQSRGADDLTILGFEAFMFFNTGHYKEAADSYAKAFKLRPSSSLLYNIAFSYWRKDSLHEAESALTKMLKIVPNNYRAQQLQANIWLMQGKLKLAIAAYEKIVTNLNNGTGLTNLSLAYALNKQYFKSIEFAQQALKKNPNHPVNLLNLADIEMILEHKESAILHYQQVVTILAGKNEIQDLTYLAQAYGQLNQANLAIATLSKAQNLAPESGDVFYSSAVVYSLLKERASAVHYVKAALKKNVGAVWFNLPWFDSLCSDNEFLRLMTEYNNVQRCINN
jgi:serine/threonine-protein kinase